MLQSG